MGGLLRLSPRPGCCQTQTNHRQTETWGFPIRSTDTQQIIAALRARDVIDQAVGLLMAQHAVSGAAALEMLVTAADSDHQLRELAADLILRPPK